MVTVTSIHACVYGIAQMTVVWLCSRTVVINLKTNIAEFFKPIAVLSFSVLFQTFCGIMLSHAGVCTTCIDIGTVHIRYNYNHNYCSHFLH